MSKLISWTLLLLLCLSLLAPGGAAAQDAPRIDQSAGGEQPKADDVVKGDKDLAGRYAALAQETLRQKVVLPAHFRQASALLMAARQLDPAEPRYARMLYEAMLQLKDADEALKALKAYRELAPNDQFAMTAYMDLKVRQMEKAEERMDYLDAIMNAEVLATEVRSQACFLASQLARERGEADKEQSFLGQALRLNPLNLDALSVKLAELSNGGTAAERLGTMLQMLKSNPVQPAITYRIAQELGDAGAVDEALRFYTLTVNLATASGMSMGREFAIGYASELYMMNQPQLLSIVKAISEQLLKTEPGDVDALLLRWLAERAGEDKDAPAKIQPVLLNAASNRLATARQRIGVSGATTRPVDSIEALAIPDLSDDLKSLKEEKNEPQTMPYAQAVADLAWYLVYAGDKPAEAAKLLPALKSLLGENHPVPVRIEGWIALKQNQADQAKLKLEAAADQDVLARMGTLLLAAKDPAQKDKAIAAARKLLMDNPSGLLATVLMDGLKSLNVKLVARQDAPALQQLVAQFPRDWLRIIDAPQGFYTLKAEMLDGRVRFPFGQPMMVKVTIRNTSQYDITIGPDGAIKNDLWFDANFRGLVQQTVTGAAYDRITGPLVLRAGQTITQMVRLDQGQLATVLAGNPQPVLTFYGQVRTNPRGEGGSSPCGYSVPFSSITEREGFSPNEQSLRALSAMMAGGTPTEKLRGLELMAALAEQFKPQAPANESAKALVTSLTDALNKAQSEPTKAVATWGMFLCAVQSPDRRSALTEKFLADPSPERRLLGLLMTNAIPPDQQIQRVKKILDSEKDESVQLYGRAMIEIAETAIAGQKNNPGPTPEGAAPAPPPAPGQP